MAPHPDRTQDTGRHRPKKLPRVRNRAMLGILGSMHLQLSNHRLYRQTLSSQQPPNPVYVFLSSTRHLPERKNFSTSYIHKERVVKSRHIILSSLYSIPSMVFYSRYPSSDTKQETGVLRVHFMDIVLHGIVISYNKYTP